METVIATAPGKVIVMGEHAVVFGRPALLASLGLYCRVTARRAAREGVLMALPAIGVHHFAAWNEIDVYTQRARELWLEFARNPVPGAFRALRGEDPAHLVKIAVGEAAWQIRDRCPAGLALTVDSEIPLASGFGSSAAVATAVVAAVLVLSGVEPVSSRVRDLVMAIERRQHGHPSGVDHVCIQVGGVIHAVRNADSELALTPLPLASGLLDRFELYHTGAAAEATGAVVSAVRERLARNNDRDALLDRMAQNTGHLHKAFSSESADPSGTLTSIRDYQRCLEVLGVVPKPVQRIVRAVEAAGGAAKISGAGSLSGPGAGALLVFWPDASPGRPEILTSLRRLSAPLGVPGFTVTRTA